MAAISYALESEGLLNPADAIARMSRVASADKGENRQKKIKDDAVGKVLDAERDASHKVVLCESILVPEHEVELGALGCVDVRGVRRRACGRAGLSHAAP